MSNIKRFFRKMNVLLFITFFCFSLVFIYAISNLYNFHWDQLFTSYQTNLLTSHAYKLMDDMRIEGITSGPVSKEEQSWMVRRSNLYGILIQFKSKDKQEIWVDMMSDFEKDALSDAVEVPFVVDGETRGYIQAAYLGANNELNPIVIEYRETMKFRSRIIYIFVIIVSFLVSLLISRLLSKNLKNLEEKTNLIRMGKRDLTIPIQGPEEVRKLAETLSEMMKELKKQEDWRRHLMEDLTHELRTPLTSMLSQLEAIIDGIYEADEAKMQDIYEELERLSRLINDMERLSEAESARFSLDIRRTDMVRLARKVYNNFLPLARNKGLRMVFESTNVPCFCEVDRDKMIQVISNILSNAIKYNKAGGKIWLSVEYTPEYTLITCEDDGIGISDEDLPYIFNRLYRADKSRSRFNSGVGLGLSIVEALVEAHGGEVRAESELGKGTKIAVKIPNVYEGSSEE